VELELELENFASIYYTFCTIQPVGKPLHLHCYKTKTWQVNRKEDGLSSNWHAENKL